MLNDVLIALRLLRRQPAFALVAIGTLALGIGANTAVFSVMHAVLLKPLPYRASDRLVVAGMSLPDYQDISAAVRSFEVSSLWACFGRRTLIGIGWMYYAGIYAIFAATDSVPVLITVFLSYGVYFGLTEGVEKAWVADLAPRAMRGTAFGYYNAALGVGALLASVIFGAIWTRVSADAAFLTGAALAMLATLLLYFLFSDAQDPRHKR